MRQNVLKLISIAFLGGLVGRGFRYVSEVVIARTLGPDALGLFAFGLVVMTISSVPARVGLDNAAQKFIPQYQNEDPSKLVGTTISCIGIPLVVGSIVSLSFYYLFPALTGKFITEEYGNIALLFAIGIPLHAGMVVGLSATRGFKETKYSVYIRDFGQSGIAILSAFVGGVLLNSLEAVIVGYILSLLFGLALALYFLFKLGALRTNVFPETNLPAILSFSLPLTFAAVVHHLLTWTDILMLGAFIGPTEVGWYQAAFRTSQVLAILLGAINALFPSLAADLYDQGDMAGLRQIYSGLTKWVLYFTLLGYMFIFVYVDEILLIFGTPTVSAQRAMLLLGAAQVVVVGTGPIGYLLNMTGYERLQLLNALGAGLVNIVLNFVLIQWLGIVGAALATGISLSLLNLARLVETWKLLDFHPYSSEYWRGGMALLGTVPVLYLSQYLPLSTTSKLPLAGVVSLLFFSTTVLLIGLTSKDEELLDSIK